MNITSHEINGGISCEFSYGEIGTNIALDSHHLIMKDKGHNGIYHAKLMNAYVVIHRLNPARYGNDIADFSAWAVETGIAEPDVTQDQVDRAMRGEALSRELEAIGGASSATPTLHTYYIASAVMKDGRAERRWSVKAPDLDTAIVASLSYNHGQSVYCYEREGQDGAKLDEQTGFGIVGKTPLAELIQFVVGHEKAVRAAHATIEEVTE